MQQKPDYLDDLIKKSARQFNISQNYNDNLMSKLKDEDRVNKPIGYNFFYKNRIAALSFILSGIIMATIATTNIDNKIVDFQGKVKSQALIFQYEYNYKFDSVKNIIGEWF
ncbi:hypothetical protein CPAST_c14630 [Clostridium pasteurianum DSM 525 = ATCC 6013]|uniref:Uncharacterized protein n=1 Tax=Clostridium pasteurianum DSM 525 = ATCC 6013 TaxID=1262449 RepID=A0A0H3J6J5_CLOPA|nr:hypothetical protein [Clostridium pasteurianum]AJA47538.1 hypothetical protein CPAST_c14630 [Clostridium pasteurianum DSM 525 = ATCC 6013]AJA51526.1 hypothetical protein CLPA_c14630 [Clostridium pasteurianum DSM 525 = ATCC 6013]AOZ74854.1 hypothetical protein AQ983_07065 [Clostridium pasteurianum DSM 525 = ATCC 6013]AOZ78649.1 hypothetical protein AQ984_07055 [Clostridium pasteurianum]ELP58121.1 hypothetical protein F502_16780 [Clostridium pasteurianum DSM 525 = ATCC 6013]